jgi:hypothetical protein
MDLSTPKVKADENGPLEDRIRVAHGDAPHLCGPFYHLCRRRSGGRDGPPRHAPVAVRNFAPPGDEPLGHAWLSRSHPPSLRLVVLIDKCTYNSA